MSAKKLPDNAKHRKKETFLVEDRTKHRKTEIAAAKLAQDRNKEKIPVRIDQRTVIYVLPSEVSKYQQTGS